MIIKNSYEEEDVGILYGDADLSKIKVETETEYILVKWERAGLHTVEVKNEN